MELIDLLNKQDWEKSNLPYSREELAREIRPRVLSSVQTIFRHYYLSLGLNGFFLLATLGLYAIRPIPDMLLPIGIIASVFGFLFLSVLQQLVAKRRIDTQNNTRQVIKDTLSYNRKMNERACQYHSLIFTASAIGGFLLGLMVQGWDLQRMLDKPLVFGILLLLAAGCFFWTRSRRFKGLNRSLNPHYWKAKSYLEEQLQMLEEER